MLEVDEVSKQFRGLRAVSRASLRVARGEIVALIGPNGAGKTTLFNLIAGVLAPTAGRIVFEGRDCAGQRPDQACKAGIGRTFQIVKPFAEWLAASLTLPDRKRLEVARALATRPKLLLLDEVMAGLRPTETDAVVAALRRLNAEHGLTLLLTEHVMRAVMALAQRVYVLHHGEVIAEGTPAEVTRDARVLESYLGSEAAA